MNKAEFLPVLVIARIEQEAKSDHLRKAVESRSCKKINQFRLLVIILFNE